MGEPISTLLMHEVCELLGTIRRERGDDPDGIYQRAQRLLDDPRVWNAMGMIPREVRDLVGERNLRDAANEALTKVRLNPSLAPKLHEIIEQSEYAEAG